MGGDVGKELTVWAVDACVEARFELDCVGAENDIWIDWMVTDRSEHTE